MKIPAGTQSGQRFTLHNEGVPSLRGGGKGDMVVEVQVRRPQQTWSKEQKEPLRQLDTTLTEQEEEGFFARLFHGHLGKQKKKTEEAANG